MVSLLGTLALSIVGGVLGGVLSIWFERWRMRRRFPLVQAKLVENFKEIAATQIRRQPTGN